MFKDCYYDTLQARTRQQKWCDVDVCERCWDWRFGLFQESDKAQSYQSQTHHASIFYKLFVQRQNGIRRVVIGATRLILKMNVLMAHSLPLRTTLPYRWCSFHPNKIACTHMKNPPRPPPPSNELGYEQCNPDTTQCRAPSRRSVNHRSSSKTRVPP